MAQNPTRRSSSRIRRAFSPRPAAVLSGGESSLSPNTMMGSAHSRTRSYDERDISSSPPMHETPLETSRLDRTMSQQIAMRGMRRFEKRFTTESAMAAKARLANFNPPIDLRMLDYVSEYDNNLMCPICRCPFVDPVVLAECDHCFCRDCIRQCWTTVQYTPLGPRGDCPTCRTPAKLGPRTAMSKILNNILEELVVKCPKSDDGCPLEMKRGEVQDHVRLYCGYGFVECPVEDCELPVRRKEFKENECQHSPASCLACQKTMRKSELYDHWRKKCPDRKVECELCKSEVLYRELEVHRQEICPATCISCPGKDYGCENRSRKALAELHAKDCILAKLAPAMKAQKERLDEQEAAQKQMVRKLEVLQRGFETMKKILAEDPDTSPSTTTQRNGLPPRNSSLHDSGPPGLSPNEQAPNDAEDLDWPVVDSLSSPTYTNAPSQQAFDRGPPSQPAPSRPGPRPSDLPAPFTMDFDLASPFPPQPVDTDAGPYASPLHHLLSMHESLRDEIARISAALQELEGRHGMQILNENLRTREEITYLGAQVAGLSRQVHWLTSSQLQRVQHGQQRGGPSAGGAVAGSSAAAAAAASIVSDIAGAGVGVEAAVQSARNALMGSSSAARRSSGEDGGGGIMRRNRSEEGRTKL